jgi:hypothetical protein
VAFLVAALYVGWTFYSRHEANRHAREELDAKQAAARKNVVDQYFGSGEIRIPTFLAENGVLKPGQTTQLCYGVFNAVSVKLDPPVEALKPTYRHCIDIAPKKTTTYTLTAFNAAGKSKSVSLEVRVEQ